MIRLLTVLALFTLSLPGYSSVKDEGQVILHMQYQLRVIGKPREIRFESIFPRDIEGQQSIVKVDGGNFPPKKFWKVEENRYAQYEFYRPSGVIELSVAITLQLFEADLFLLSKRRNDNFLTKAYLRPYLKAENGIEKDDPAIASAAKGLEGTNDIDTIRKAYGYVVSNITFKDDPTNFGGALDALSKKQASSSGMADLMVALLRANGMASRTVEGFMVKPRGSDPRHTWCEVYIERYGWVPFDPAGGAIGLATFDRLRPAYIRASTIRNDAALGDAHYFQVFTKGEGTVSGVEELFFIE